MVYYPFVIYVPIVVGALGMFGYYLKLSPQREVSRRGLEESREHLIRTMAHEIDSLRSLLSESEPSLPKPPCEAIHQTVPVTLMSGEQVSTWCITCQKPKHSQRWIMEGESA